MYLLVIVLVAINGCSILWTIDARWTLVA